MTYAPNSPDTLTSRWLFGTGLFALLASGALVGLGLSWVLGTGTNALDQHGVMFAESLVPFGHEGAGAVFLGGSLAAFVAGCWLLATRTTPSRRVHADIPTWVGGLGICAVLVVIDQSPLVVIGYLPFTLLAPLFGFDEVDIGALASYPLLLQWLLLLIACAIAGMVYQRHRPRLQGLTAPVTEAERQRSLARATTRTNRWTKVAMESPLVYALSRILMFCCVPGFRFAGFGDPILYAGLGLAFMATMGAWLTCGLIRPWGEVFPRWMIGLRGRRVPIRLAVIAGLLVAVMLAATCKG
ncbi:MAG: hypothetical protein ACRDP4_01980, partial [Nocardioidaceae bacterium]